MRKDVEEQMYMRAEVGKDRVDVKRDRLAAQHEQRSLWMLTGTAPQSERSKTSAHVELCG